MHSTDCPKRKPDYYLEMIDNEMLLYHPSRTIILYCNQTASLIWQLCDGQHTVQEITMLLANAFPKASETIAAEVVATLEQFFKNETIEVAED
jgi:hypothetical protein